VKLLPDKVGGNPKQLAILGGLAVLLAVAYFLNRTPSAPGPVTSAPQRPAAIPQIPATQKAPSVARRASSRISKTGEDWHPTIKLPEGIDVSKIDPTIHFDLLAKLRSVPTESGSRGSVFAFGKEPPPPPPPPSKERPVNIQAGPLPTANNNQPKQEDKSGAAAAPKPPPIPLKFYGYSTAARGGAKRAFFLDGEDIDVVSENEVIKNRYKIIRIGVNSVVVEDMNFKSQQTLPLVEELAG